MTIFLVNKFSSRVPTHVHICATEGLNSGSGGCALPLEQCPQAPSFFVPFVIFYLDSYVCLELALGYDSPIYSLLCSWDDKCMPPDLAYWLRWVSLTFCLNGP
jgi:hypothetical protein